METPTSGDIYINGESKLIGYCPQSSILYDNMTVEEHLEFYARLKKDNTDKVEHDVIKMMREMKIIDKAHVLSKNLSEGLKRRLSVGISFIGNSKVVILDEPTSGVDPNARKDIWKLITSHKKNRTILVSTHYIDEAELLCDKIIIMHKGKKVEEGSSLDFQTKFGNDLRLEIYTDEDSADITSYNSSKSSTPRSVLAPDDDIDKQIKEICPIVTPASASQRKRTYTLPSQKTENLSLYQKLFAVLENEKEILKIKTFSIYSPSLEEIFLEILESDNNRTIENIIFNQNKSKSKINPFSKQSQRRVTDLSDLSIASPTPTITSSTASLNSLTSKTNQYKGFTLYLRQVLALLMKRFCNFKADKKMILMTFVLPLILLTLAMVTAMIRPITQTPVLLLTPSMYGPGSVSFTSYNNSDQNEMMESLLASPGIGTTCMDNMTCLDEHYVSCGDNSGNTSVPANTQSCSCSSTHSWECREESQLVSVLVTQEQTTDTVYQLDDGVDPNQWILNSFNEFIEKRYGGWKFGLKANEFDNIGLTKDNIAVYYNNKGFHSVAAYLNGLNNARLRSSLGEEERGKYGITAYSHPIRSKDGQIKGQSLEQHISDYALALLMAVVLTFLPASSIIYLIEERRTEQKLVQRTFGVGPFTYWMTVFLWDTMISLVFLALATLVIYIFQIRSFTANSNLGATVLLMLLYLMASSSFVYIIEKAFSEPSLGQIIVLTSFIFVSLVTSITMLLLTMFWWIPTLRSLKKLLEVLLLIFPPYALSKYFL